MCEHIVRVARSFEQSKEVIENCCWVIRNFSINKDNSTLLVDAGVCDVLCSIILHNLKHDQIMEIACNSIISFVYEQPKNLLCFKKAVFETLEVCLLRKRAVADVPVKLMNIVRTSEFDGSPEIIQQVSNDAVVFMLCCGCV